MRAYTAVFKIRFSAAIQYRAAALSGIVTQFLWGLFEILAFTVIYKNNSHAFQMTLEQVVAYTWLKEAFLILLNPYFNERDILEVIRNGNISYELSRPLDLYYRWFFQSGANRIASSLLRCVPILAVVFFLPAPFRMMLPPDVLQLLGFLISLMLALGVVLTFSTLVYGLTLYTISSTGLWVIFTMLASFLSGAVIPIAFFPSGFRKVVELLPFGAMMNMPLRIYSGNISGMDIITGILVQCFWLIMLVIIGRFAMKRVLSKIVVQGG